MERTIEIDDKKVYKRKYKLRRTGAQGSTIEITIPREVVEREARCLGITEEEAVEKLLGVWRYNNFHGVHLSFEPKKETTHTEEVRQ